MTNEEAINALTMCQELMLFDPMTGETHELWEENKDNQDLYNACGVAIAALREQAERNKGCEYCKQVIATVKMDFETDSILGENKWFSSTRRPKYCPMCGRRLEAQRE